MVSVTIRRKVTSSSCHARAAPAIDAPSTPISSPAEVIGTATMLRSPPSTPSFSRTHGSSTPVMSSTTTGSFERSRSSQDGIDANAIGSPTWVLLAHPRRTHPPRLSITRRCSSSWSTYTMSTPSSPATSAHTTDSRSMNWSASTSSAVCARSKANRSSSTQRAAAASSSRRAVTSRQVSTRPPEIGSRRSPLVTSHERTSPSAPRNRMEVIGVG